MADIELDDLGKTRDLLCGPVVQAVAGVHLKAEPGGQTRTFLDLSPFGSRGGLVLGDERVAPRTGMNLDCGCTKLGCGPDLLRIGSDEQRYRNASPAELGYDRLKHAALLDDIEAAFGRTLLAPLRNQASRMRPRFHGDVEHFFRRGHFEIERF